MDYELYHGDCLDILPTLAPQSVDAVIADIPSGRTACAWDSVIPFDAMWAGIKRVVKKHAAIVLLGCTQPFTSALVMSNVKQYRHEWIWRKTRASNFAVSDEQPLKVHESILVFSSDPIRYYPQMTKGAAYHTRTQVNRNKTVFGAFKGNDYNPNEIREVRYPLSVIDVPSMRQQDRLHPTQKPLALLEYLVRTYTNAGDAVLDFTFGSGTTGAACGNLGRRFIGIEKDDPYFALGSERIATAYAPLRMMQGAV